MKRWKLSNFIETKIIPDLIVKDFPSPKSTEKGNCIVTRHFGTENIVVNAQAKNIEYKNISSPLSLKYAISGREWYSFSGREVLVDNEHFLLMDQERTYSTFIQSDSTVESFCIFFENDVLDELHTFYQTKTSSLLDDPHHFQAYDQPIIEKRFKVDVELLQLLHDLKEQVDSGEAEFLDYRIYPVLNKVFLAQQALKDHIAQLPFGRKATRLELYKRIALVQDYIDSCPQEKLDLDTLAKISCLSKYHFLRVFKEIHGISPHKYIVQRKLEHSIKLIKTGIPIVEVSRAIGFNSAAAYCRLFKQRLGQSPGSLRPR